MLRGRLQRYTALEEGHIRCHELPDRPDGGVCVIAINRFPDRPVEQWGWDS